MKLDRQQVVNNLVSVWCMTGGISFTMGEELYYFQSRPIRLHCITQNIPQNCHPRLYFRLYPPYGGNNKTEPGMKKNRATRNTFSILIYPPSTVCLIRALVMSTHTQNRNFNSDNWSADDWSGADVLSTTSISINLSNGLSKSKEKNIGPHQKKVEKHWYRRRHW